MSAEEQLSSTIGKEYEKRVPNPNGIIYGADDAACPYLAT